MKILLVNDDGYNAEGLKVLIERFKDEHEIFVVAPENEMSATSHSVSFFKGVTCREVEICDGIRGYAVGGTPADCVLIAVKMLFSDTRFDFVISGINSVLNLGTDIMYSGTFCAAKEATFQRLKGIAVSVNGKKEGAYKYAADFIARNLQSLGGLIKNNVTLNVNIPSLLAENRGVKVCSALFQPYDEVYDILEGEDGVKLYSVHGVPYPQPEGVRGDCTYFKEGYITVSPIELLSNSREIIESANSKDFRI